MRRVEKISVQDADHSVGARQVSRSHHLSGLPQDRDRCKEASLSGEKPEVLLAALQAWSYSKEIMSEAWITLPDWQTQFHWFHYSISASCIFLHCLIDWSTTARMPYHHITMSVEAHQDIPWWLKFLPTCNDCGLIGNTHWSDLWTLHRCICTLSYGFTMLVTVLLSPGLPH